MRTNMFKNLRKQRWTLIMMVNYGLVQRAVIMDRQWRVAKAEDAFYNKVNTPGTSVRKNPQTNNYGQLNSEQMAPHNNWSWKPAPSFPPPQQQQQSTPLQSSKPADPDAMNVDRNKQQRRAPLKCYNCNGDGHFARDCKAQRRVRQLTFEEAKDLYKQMDAARKDHEEIAKKVKEQKDFPNATQ